jgi:hypothetical protein
MLMIEPQREVLGSPPTTLEGGNGGPKPPDPEVEQKPRRRHYSARYKLRVLQETDPLCFGEVGAYLRRAGLYWSALLRWRKERKEGLLAGLAPKKRGRHQEAHSLSRVVAQKEREITRLQHQLQVAQKVNEVQKKLFELFGVDPMTGSPREKS